MGFLTKISLIYIALTAIYATVHDFFGLQLVSKGVFDKLILPSFLAFLFLSLVKAMMWVYSIIKKPPSKKCRRILEVVTVILSIGVFFTGIPIDQTSTINLVIGKIFLIGGIGFGYLCFKKA